MSQQFNASPDNLTLAVDCTADFETVVNRGLRSEPVVSAMAILDKRPPPVDQMHQLQREGYNSRQNGCICLLKGASYAAGD